MIYSGYHYRNNYNLQYYYIAGQEKNQNTVINLSFLLLLLLLHDIRRLITVNRGVEEGLIVCAGPVKRNIQIIMSISNAIRSVLRPLSIWPSNNAFAIRTVGRSFTAGTITNDDMTTDIVEEIAEATTPLWSPKMIAWQAHSYSTIDDLVLTSNARSPVVVGPRELLVRVKASSVNPLDTLMAGK